MNAWKQLLHVIYIEFVQRGMFDDFIDILGAPVGTCIPPNTKQADVSTEHACSKSEVMLSIHLQAKQPGNTIAIRFCFGKF